MKTLLAFIAVMCVAGSAAADDLYYQLQGIGGLVLQQWGGGGAGVGPIALNYGGVAHNNLWRVTSDGYIVNPNGYCLRADRRGSPNESTGDYLILDGCVDRPDYKWRVERDHIFSAGGRCVQAWGGKAEPGTEIRLNECDPERDNSPNNTWKMVTPTDPKTAGESTKELGFASACRCVYEKPPLTYTNISFHCGEPNCRKACIRTRRLWSLTCTGGTRECAVGCYK